MNDSFVVMYPIECTNCLQPLYLLRIMGMNAQDFVYTSIKMVKCACRSRGKSLSLKKTI